MTNTHPRAHVAGPTTIPASATDLDLENQPTSDEKQRIQSAQVLNRKEKRKQKQQKLRDEKLEFSESDDVKPTQTSLQSDGESEEQTDEAQLSRKQRKKLRKERLEWGELDSSVSPSETSSNSPKDASKTRKPTSASSTAVSIPFTLSTNPSMPPTTHFPLLVCSIGNPGAQFANTLHSAGHTILNIIQDKGRYQPFTKGMSGLVSTPNTTVYKFHPIKGYVKTQAAPLEDEEDDFTLWQSLKLMNVCGPAVHSAWRTFSAQQRARGLEGRLVVVHDELESPLGEVKIKDGMASPRGHNGLKSVQASLGGNKWWRVGVGIGRPDSRDPAVVSKYVLRKMTYTEDKAMYKSSQMVIRALRMIAEGKA